MRNGGYPENGDLADLLSVLRKADAVYCEVPFCQQQGSEIVNGVIDLLYRTGDVWHIIDYKTNAEQKQLAEKYAAQLSAYRDAVRAIVGAEADTGIYHIDV
jgi:ATP-dependent helicase/nuclease subunit A